MYPNDCNCLDILEPTESNLKLEHIKCKIIKLVDDQMLKAHRYIQEMSREEQLRIKYALDKNRGFVVIDEFQANPSSRRVANALLSLFIDPSPCSSCHCYDVYNRSFCWVAFMQ